MILSSHSRNLPSQYFCACGIWNTSSCGSLESPSHFAMTRMKAYQVRFRNEGRDKAKPGEAGDCEQAWKPKARPGEQAFLPSEEQELRDKDGREGASSPGCEALGGAGSFT